MKRADRILCGLGGVSVVVVSIWVLGSYLDVRRSREYSLNAQECRATIKSIAGALLLYHDEWGCFPPMMGCADGPAPELSWRVLILPYLARIDPGRFAGGRHIYARYNVNKRWSAEENRSVCSEGDVLFHCNAHSNRASDSCSYLAVVCDYHSWYTGRPTKCADAMRPLTDILLVVEFNESVIRWNEPRDILATEFEKYLGNMKKKASERCERFVVVFGDGSVQEISSVSDLESLLRAM